MKNNTYWKNRFEQLEDSLHRDAIKVFNENQLNFEVAEREINQEIARWYQRFANNNEITISEAKKWLNTKELKELKWDINEYIKYGRENDINGKWIKELENASAKYHISRLEALKLQTRQTVEALYNNENDLISTMIKKTYSDGYYRTCYEIQKGFNIGFDIGTIDQRKLEKIIGTPWAADGKNFSDRIWTSKAQLINEVHNELTRICVLGKSPDDAIKNIAKKFNTSKVQSGRLIMTEQAYFSSLSQKEAFNDLDVEKFEIVATLDSHTSAICQSMDGEVFEMKDFEPGVTAPPFHPNCRSVTVPYFNDEFSLGERAAKDEDGKTYYVPSNTKYSDWKKNFVEETELKQFKTSENNGKIDENKILSVYKGNDNLVVNAMENAEKDETVYKILNNIDKLDEVEIVRGKKSSYLVGLYNNELTMSNMSDYDTFYHEWTHSLDHMVAYKRDYGKLGKDFKWISENLEDVRLTTLNKINNTIPDALVTELQKQKDNLYSIIKKDYLETGKIDEIVNKTIMKKYGDLSARSENIRKHIRNEETKKEIQKVLKKLVKEDRNYNGWSCVSDIYDAITSGNATNSDILTGIHGSDYFNSSSMVSLTNHGKVHSENTEMLAEYGELRLGNYKEQLKWLKDNDEELYNKLEETFKMLGDELEDL